ncbi:MAG TPA: hypothetical protein VEK79_14255 [Thermoanaerobaculia bacterium]|nr:hypothetical protein [Thermoanaerobaculia bacterium]
MIQSRCVALVVLLLLGTSAFAADEAIPDRFDFKFDGAPIWVSAARAIAADGSVRPGVLRPEVRDELRDRRREQAARDDRQQVIQDESWSRCDVNFFGSVDGADVYPARTLEDLVDFAATRSVISGVVAGSAVGLHGGKPHTVLQIKTDASAEGPSVAYLLYPSGKLRYDGMTVCNDDPAFSAPPMVGDAVTFVAASAIDSTGTLFVTDGSWILYEHAGATVLPPGLQSDAKLRRIPTARALALFLREGREVRRGLQRDPKMTTTTLKIVIGASTSFSALRSFAASIARSN